MASADEIILYRSSPPLFRNHPFWFVLCVVLILAFGLGLIILAVWYVIEANKKLIITKTELRYEEGILNKKRSELRLDSVRSVRVNQTLWQRMFGTGDVDIYSAGDSPEISAKGMPDPARIRELT